MATAFGKAISLADEIVQERRKQIEEEYFRETSKKTYEKYFVMGYDKSGKPYLNPQYHGGYTRPDGNGRVHYYMLKRKYYSLRKVGKRMMPVREEMEEAARDATNLMKINEQRLITKNRTERGCDITLTYSGTAPSEYKAEYGGFMQGNKKENEYRYGKMSSLDKLIVRSVQSWAAKNGLTIAIKSEYGDGE